MSLSKAYTLRRKRIIRGFNRFNYILENGRKVISNNLTAFCLKEEKFSDQVLEVGFLISKKKFKNLTIGII